MKILTINNKQLRFGAIIYRVILDWSYVFAIAPSWSYYMNLTFDFSLGRLLISYALTGLLCLYTPCVENKISSLFLNLQLYIFLIPMCSLYALSGRSLVFLFGLGGCHFLQCMMFKLHCADLLKKKLSLRNNEQLLFLCLGVLLLIPISYLIMNVGISGLQAFNLYEVYEVRKQSISLRNGMQYLLPWTMKIIVPYMLIYSINKRKWGWAGILFSISMYVYSIFAQKTFLFTPFLVIAVYIMVKKSWIRFGFEKGISIIVFVTSLLYLLHPRWIMPVSLAVRRVLFVPATIKFAYYDYFSQNPKVFFADGIIGKLFAIRSPYSKEIPKIIAEVIGRPDSNCNAGYLADAYANLGWAGVILFSIIIVFFLKALDHFSKKMNIAVALAVSSYLLYSLNDSALLTTLLTGGGGVLLLIFLINSMRSAHEKV